MNRSHHYFDCEGEYLAGTIDDGPDSTGLLIVSGGNEIRSGAHAGMAKLSHKLAEKGYPIFRYDRRGIGESMGHNGEYLNSCPDMLAAANYFRSQYPNVKRLLAFGNCDAATALALFGSKAGIDLLILANPWVMETQSEGDESADTTSPSPSAIRARYWERIKNPRTILDLLNGRINLRKTLKGLKQASKKQQNNALTLKLRNALESSQIPTRILLCDRDTTARSFQAAWSSDDFNEVRSKASISVQTINSASHSFADEASSHWLEEQIANALQAE